MHASRLSGRLRVAFTYGFNWLYGAVSFNQDIGDWDVSGATDLRLMFHRADSFDQDIGAWEDAFGDNTMEEMFDGSGLFTANYDALLIGWAALDLHPDVTLDAQGISHSAAASSARQSLIDEAGWTINDAGVGQD